jgi:hypothetical protein
MRDEKRQHARLIAGKNGSYFRTAGQASPISLLSILTSSYAGQAAVL